MTPLLGLGLALLAACPGRPFTPSTVFHRLGPLRADATASLAYAARHFPAIYGNEPARLGGLQPIYPVLGRPALVKRGTDLEVAYLTRAAALTARHLERGLRFRLVDAGRPCPGTGCHRLGRVKVVSRARLPGGVFHVRVRVRIPDRVTDGFYDLIHQLTFSAQIRRSRSAVRVLWRDPDEVHPFSFVHLTDTHQGAEPRPRLALVVRWINALKPRPAFAVHTGDLVEFGPEPAHWAQALKALEKLRVPLFLVPGNHDYYRPAYRLVRPPKGLFKAELGLRSFLRHVHPWLAYRFGYGGYRFLAVDTGSDATLRSLWQGKWITTQGLHASQLKDIERFLASRASVGHVLFGHAPSRARFGPRADGCEPGRHGCFLVRRQAFEQALLDSWQRRPRPIAYLNGHTHWNEIYTRGTGPQCRFAALKPLARPLGALPCWRHLADDRFPMLLTTQSATKHNPLRSGGLLQRGMRFGQGAGAGFGFRVLHVRATRWLSASYRFDHRAAATARDQPAGLLPPRARSLLSLPACPR